MKKSLKVSVIIPVYNRFEWARQAIQSVLEQTYQNLEIIVIDDGSERDARKEIDIKDDRILFLWQENKGPASARNRGIDIADGDLLAFLDSDDLFFPEKLEKQVIAMEAKPEFLLSHTSYQYFDDTGEKLDIVDTGNISGNVFPGIINNCKIATPTVMLRKEVFKDGLRFNSQLRIAEDVILWIAISRISKFLAITEPLTLIRKRKNNAAFNHEAQISGNFNIINYAIRDNSSLTGVLKARFIANKYFQIASHYWLANRKLKSLEYLIFSFMRWPFDVNQYKKLCHYIVDRLNT